MGCISRLLVAAALAVQIIAAALGMLVLGSAGVLGEAALISSTDAVVVFVMLALSLVATFVLAIKHWFNSRNRKRLEQALASATVTVQTPHPSAIPR